MRGWWKKSGVLCCLDSQTVKVKKKDYPTEIKESEQKEFKKERKIKWCFAG